MKTIIAETVMLGREAFETLGDVEVLPDRSIGPQHLADADALIIRSKTIVTPELLEGSTVRFVGTATAGFEHIDFQRLEKSHIGWTAAPGCNAESVADYITAALLRLHSCARVELEGKTLGIIGVGQVGHRVAKRAEALGLRVLLNDPPREAREFPTLRTNGVEACDSISNLGKNEQKVSKDWKNQPSEDALAQRDLESRNNPFQPLETLLNQADFVTLHVPLIKGNPWPTLRLADDAFFAQMKRGSVFINASRGQVLDADALLRAKENGIVSHAVLDVWDPEPQIRGEVLATADIGTPHIAGHSLEGKLNGTVQVYREACRFFETVPVWDPASLLPAIAVPKLEINPHGKTDNEVLAEAVAAVYNIMADDRSLRSAPETFDFLRAHYGVRREFKNTRVTLTESRPGLAEKIEGAGFDYL